MTRARPSIFQRLYDSEINAGCQSFWDAGWNFWIGGACRTCATFAEGEAWLEAKARDLYPDSVFAKGRAG